MATVGAGAGYARKLCRFGTRRDGAKCSAQIHKFGININSTYIYAYHSSLVENNLVREIAPHFLSFLYLQVVLQQQ